MIIIEAVYEPSHPPLKARTIMKHTTTAFLRTRLALLLVLVMVASLVPSLSASAASPEDLPNWEDRAEVSGQAFQEVGTTLDSYSLTDENGTKTITVDHSAPVGSETNPISIPDEAALILFGLQPPVTSGPSPSMENFISPTDGKYYILDKADGFYDMDGDNYEMFPLFTTFRCGGTDQMTMQSAFRGKLIGNGSTVSNITLRPINDKLDHASPFDVLESEGTMLSYDWGFIATTMDALATDLTIDGIKIHVEDDFRDSNTDSDCIGGFCGQAITSFFGNIAVNDVQITAEASSIVSVGGFCSGGMESSFENISVNGLSVSFENQIQVAGGLLALAHSSSIKNCSFVSEPISLNAFMLGGLIGAQANDMDIANCYVNCDIHSLETATMLGGLIGNVMFLDYSVTSNEAPVPTDISGSMKNSYYNGELTAVSGGARIGGLVGFYTPTQWDYEDLGIYVENCSSIYLDNTIENCYYSSNIVSDIGEDNRLSPENEADNGLTASLPSNCDSFDPANATVSYNGGAEIPLVDALNNFISDQGDDTLFTWAVQSETNDGLPFFGERAPSTPSIPDSDLTVSTKTDENAPKTTLSDDKSAIADAVLTPEELERIEDGESAEIWLEVTDDKNVSEEAKAAIEKESGDYNIGMFIDISLFKQFENDDSATPVHKTNKPLTISIVIPAELVKDGRTFAIARYHDGVVDIIKGTFDKATSTFTFKTDRFSDYAILYTDATVANTPDSDSLPLAILLVFASGLALAATVIYDKKQFALNN